MTRALFIFALLIPLPLFAHGGGLNADGCHNNRKTGGYHCHRSQTKSSSKKRTRKSNWKPRGRHAKPVKKKAPKKRTRHFNLNLQYETSFESDVCFGTRSGWKRVTTKIADLACTKSGATVFVYKSPSLDKSADLVRIFRSRFKHLESKDLKYLDAEGRLALYDADDLTLAVWTISFGQERWVVVARGESPTKALKAFYKQASK